MTPDLPLACRPGIWGLDFYLTRSQATLIFSPTSPFRISLTGSSSRTPLLVVKRVPPLPFHLGSSPLPLPSGLFVSAHLPHTSCGYNCDPRNKPSFSKAHILQLDRFLYMITPAESDLHRPRCTLPSWLSCGTQFTLSVHTPGLARIASLRDILSTNLCYYSRHITCPVAVG